MTHRTNLYGLSPQPLKQLAHKLGIARCSPVVYAGLIEEDVIPFLRFTLQALADKANEDENENENKDGDQKLLTPSHWIACRATLQAQGYGFISYSHPDDTKIVTYPSAKSVSEEEGQ